MVHAVFISIGRLLLLLLLLLLVVGADDTRSHWLLLRLNWLRAACFVNLKLLHIKI